MHSQKGFVPSTASKENYPDRMGGFNSGDPAKVFFGMTVPVSDPCYRESEAINAQWGVVFLHILGKILPAVNAAILAVLKSYVFAVVFNDDCDVRTAAIAIESCIQHQIPQLERF
jgi:hypothetical protein